MFQLTVDFPADPLSASLARALARELAQQAGIDTDFAAAVQAAAQNVLQHAPGSFSLRAELSEHDLIVHLVDRGAPMQGAVQGAAGHGLARIAQSVDEVRWVPLGRQGKELFMRKALPHARAPEVQALPPDVPQAPPQEYTVRRLRLEDAPGVPRLTYQVYGYSYQHEELYYPERLAAMNRSGRLCSMVALDAAGEVVGHYALELTPGSRVAEAGEALVSPAHRGRKLMERMGEKLEAEAPALGLEGIFSEAVTLHPYSQKAAEGFGRVPCGIVLNLIPGQAGRTTCVFYFQHVVPPRPRTVHLPSRYRELALSLYAKLGDPVVPAEGAPPEGPGALQVELQPDYQYGNIRVLHPGQDSAAHIAQALQDLTALGQVPSVYLELPLWHPGAPALCEEARAQGFFFSALTPLFAPEGDILRLQWLSQPIEPERIHLNADASRELLAFSQSDRP